MVIFSAVRWYWPLLMNLWHYISKSKPTALKSLKCMEKQLKLVNFIIFIIQPSWCTANLRHVSCVFCFPSTWMLNYLNELIKCFIGQFNTFGQGQAWRIFNVTLENQWNEVWVAHWCHTWTWASRKKAKNR